MSLGGLKGYTRKPKVFFVRDKRDKCSSLSLSLCIYIYMCVCVCVNLGICSLLKALLGVSIGF